MRTKTELESKIQELRDWLSKNSPEHEARTQIESDLRNLEKELEAHE